MGGKRPLSEGVNELGCLDGKDCQITGESDAAVVLSDAAVVLSVLLSQCCSPLLPIRFSILFPEFLSFFILFV